MDETEITKFDYTASQLHAIVAETKDIKVVDLENKEEIEKVKKARLALGKLRVDIKKFGKSKRDWFNSMSAKIITREKELVKIVEDEEDRLYKFEEEVAKKQLMADRIAVLPQRKFQLSNIKDGVEVTDEFLCSMNAEQFMAYANKRVADKNEADRVKLQEREDEIKKQEDKIKHDQEIKDAEEKARKDEIENREKKEKEDNERIYKLKIEARMETLNRMGLHFDGSNSFVKEDFNVSMVEVKMDSDSDFAVKVERMSQEMTRRVDVARMEKEQKEIEAKQKAEQAELESEMKYQNWLVSVGYTESGDYHFETVGTTIKLYKLVSTYEKNTQTES
jgi:hypothetical protein